MPYNITPFITKDITGEWGEGAPYDKEEIYRIRDGGMPPVNYDKHIIKSHSITHIETPRHTQLEGNTIEYYFKNNLNHFYGSCLVLKFDDVNWVNLENGIRLKEITEVEIIKKLNQFKDKIFNKVLITVSGVRLNEFGFHNPKDVLVLSIEAAKVLTSIKGFNLFGTTWKSSDYKPGKVERPVHNELFSKAVILENIVLNDVPEGEYFITCFPLPIVNASESPVCAVLFEKNEI